MEHTFDVTVSQAHADSALRRFLLRRLGWETLLASILSIGYAIFDLTNGGKNFFGIGILVLFALFVAVYIIAYVTRKQQMAELLKQIGDEPIVYHLNDSGLGAESAMGNSHLKWEMLQKVWIYPDLIMIFYAKNGYSTVPLEQIPSDALDFLTSEVKEAGGTIQDKRRT